MAQVRNLSDTQQEIAFTEHDFYQKQIEEDVRFNPTILPIQQLPTYLKRLKDEVKSLDNVSFDSICTINAPTPLSLA